MPPLQPALLQANVRPQRSDADDDMPLPPPARRPSTAGASKPTAASGISIQDEDDNGPTFQAPDEDTIRYMPC